MDIFVLTTRHRRPLTLNHLKGYDYQTYINDDLPYCGEQPYSFLNANDLGAFRCFQGHAAIAQLLTANSLIFEDDCVPIYSTWHDTALTALELLSDFEVVSLHCRFNDCDIDTTFRHKGSDFVTLKEIEVEKQGKAYRGKWGAGSLAFLITPTAAQRLTPYDGLPFDLVLCNRFKFCAIRSSPFSHDRKQGSLVETAI